MLRPPILFTALTICALAALLVAEARGSRRGRYAAKPLASLGFIAVGLAVGAADTRYGTLVLAGLVLGAAGDVALMFPGGRAFLAGLVAFLLGHLAYVVAFAEVAPPTAWATSPWALAPVLVAAIVLPWLWPHLGRMKGPVLAYLAVITAMVVGAIAAYAAAGSLLLLTGAIAFFASDLAVARERFVRRTFANKAWGLPAYYGGQLLLAWSAAARP